MSMDEKTVRKVARLANIEIADHDVERIGHELSGILDWVEQLGEVDTENVEPLANVVNIELPLRKDEVTDGNCSEKVLANAPEETQGFFVVPKVVEQEG
ncbi:MAG TPA: Asp-tRNA(Asn)/Glu-tRNA(Gln) amidotransferase subunit GatC [Alphaproteobacteria bacterium]|nr:Asp-tRNA(Asn)/Glu-tRNA(Gln) amidotransferase subunit GatC [Alphaproteobacteria bacterium]USO06344.1 MAG: Asp-tRNA(Asn)/Glu-tRNA(Gln) amidotransferase subunit GatC [Rhodospirillales bacterium]HOO81152.1 Asp-tRNA(Asn)/Glu-tRNA(Gln) amidotransferase subunit GatC [Alphaproteobacteria bacterium]